MTNEAQWLEAQCGVIGSVMIEPSLAPRLAAETEASDFYGSCRLFYEAICKMLVDKEPIDVVTICNRIGGEAIRQDAIQLMNHTPTSANFDGYIAACKEQARLTQLQELGMALTNARTLDEARELVSKAQALTVERRGYEVKTMQEMIDSFMERHQANQPVEYLDWGLDAINRRVHITKGKYVILGGYPSDGKSALMLQTALHMARTQRVGVFSLETDTATATDRLMAHAAQLKLAGIMANDLRLEDWNKLTRRAGEIYTYGLEVIEAAGMRAEDIAALAVSRNYDVVFVDYLQLVTPPRTGNRNDEVAAISRTLQTLAKKHKINVVALSQLSRPETTRDGQTPAPTLRSLRESGQLEQDADVVLLLYKQDSRDNNSPRTLKVAKNKEGTWGAATLEFDGARQTFSSAQAAPAQASFSDLAPADGDNPF